MTKFAVILVAALAFGAVYAEQIPKWIQGIKTETREDANEAWSTLKNVEFDSNETDNRGFRYQANELAYKIQTANYHLERVIVSNPDSENLEKLEDIFIGLRDISHSILQSINVHPLQLKNLLRNQLPKLVTQMDNLAGVAQLEFEKETRGEDHYWGELEDVMEDFSDAIRQFKISRQLDIQNHQRVKGKIQAATNELINTVQNFNNNDEGHAQLVSEQILELTDELGHIIHVLTRDADNRIHDETAPTLRQILHKLREIRAGLDEVSNNQGRTNPQVWVKEMKNMLKTNIGAIAVQTERLLQVARSGNESYLNMRINNLISNVIAEILSETRALQWHLKNFDDE